MIPIAFQHVQGSHTGEAIKLQFDEITKQWGLHSKIFKIVTDQAANMKKAFGDTFESEDIISVTKNLLQNQMRLDRLAEIKRSEEDMQCKLIEEINLEIQKANSSMSVGRPTERKKACDILAELDELTLDSDEEEILEDTILNDTLDDQDENALDDDSFLKSSSRKAPSLMSH